MSRGVTCEKSLPSVVTRRVTLRPLLFSGPFTVQIGYVTRHINVTIVTWRDVPSKISRLYKCYVTCRRVAQNPHEMTSEISKLYSRDVTWRHVRIRSVAQIYNLLKEGIICHECSKPDQISLDSTIRFKIRVDFYILTISILWFPAFVKNSFVTQKFPFICMHRTPNHPPKFMVQS